MGSNPGELNTQVQDRGFFMRNARDRRRPRGRLVILWIGFVLSSLAAGAMWVPVIQILSAAGGRFSFATPPMLIIAVVSSLTAVGCLLGIVVPAVMQRRRVRRSHAEFMAGGALWWQADLGIIIDSLDYLTKKVETLALILPPEAGQEEAYAAAQVIGQRISTGQGTAFMAIDESVVHRGRGWPADGSAVDHLGYRFAPLRPGRHVAVLPDGAVLGIASGQPLDVSEVVRRHDADRIPLSAGSEQVFRTPVWFKALCTMVIFLVTGVLGHMAGILLAVDKGFPGFPTALMIWFLIVAGGSLGVVVFLISLLFGETRIGDDGVHISRVFWRRTIPWHQVRGFAVWCRGQLTRVGESSMHTMLRSRQVVVVEDSGRTRVLPGALVPGGRRAPEVVEMLCRLDGLRRWRQ
ncbi:MAG: hypothetical protein Q4D89_11475 [Arachnia propionica]|uniref:hypothetical protein n=1 Tax=Arachnia propionica TaxID=1750 RepID=UPI0026FE4701|nr:hypothetical protein [Arachnia propionica]